MSIRIKGSFVASVMAVAFAVSLFAVSGASAATGAELYKTKCQACHGPDGSGQTTMGKKFGIRDLRSDAVQKQTDLELTKVIAGGKGKMPAFGKQLTTADIEAIIAHIRTLKK